MNNRRSYLIQQQSLGLLSDAEQAELGSMEDIRYRDDGTPGMVFPAPLKGNTHEEKLADFARRFMFDDREATPEECAVFANGGKVATPNGQAPVNDHWADDAEPPAANTITVVVSDADAQSSTDPGTAAGKLKDALQIVGANSATPQATDDEMIEVRDPSYPHDPPKLIRRSLWEKQQRKQRINSAQARAGRTIGRG